MKKIIFMLIFTLFGNTIFSQIANYIYDSKGNKIYFQKNSNVNYFKFVNKLTEVQKQDFLTTLSAKSVTYEEIATDLFKMNVPLNLTSSTMQILNNKEIVEFCSSEMLYVQDSTIQWAGNHIFVHPKENYSLISLLDSLNISYLEIDTISQYLPNQYIVTISNDNALDCANRLFESGSFIYSQPAFYRLNVLNNEYYSEQWGLKNVGQFGGAIGIDVNVEPAWNITNGNANIKIAVLDDGVDIDHIDLAENILFGYDILGHGSNGANQDPYNHGTLCSGIISAIDNSVGIKGVANNCKIIPIRTILSSGIMYDVHYLLAVRLAIDKGADILNCSWNLGNDLHSLTNIIDVATSQGRNGKGCIVVFSAGNDNSLTIPYPACLSNVITVGSINRKGTKSTFSNYGNALDIVAPGEDIITTNINDSYISVNGTSYAAPHVAGIAALMLSVNPELTSVQVKNIIEQTAKKIENYSYNDSSAHPNGPWNNQVGYGLVDAYAAVRASLDVDLYTRDNSSDSGTEPLVNILDGFNDSPDIWLRREPDGGTTHQLGRQGEENYVYIRVHNRGENTSFGSDVVKLYIKRAGIGTNVWNEDWTMIGETTIPQIPSGASDIVRIDAEFPTYHNFEWSQNLPDVSYALLARIESDFDNVTYTEFENTGMNVIQNNNISCKNVVMTNAVLLDDVITDVAIVGIDNTTEEMLFTSLKFSSPINEYGNPLSNEAEIRIVFPSELVQSWNDFDKIGLEHINDNTFLVVEDNAMLENICIPKKYEGLVKVQINFLTEEYSEKDKFEYVIEQYVPGSEEMQNRLTVLVDKNQRDNLFSAKCGEDLVVKENTIITLSAEDIGENAVYNWYNTSGDFVDRGRNISVTASSTEKYTLEVIAKADGYKDYDSMYVVTTLGKIESITPNPASGQTILTYDLSSNVSNARIIIVNSSGLQLYNSPIDVSTIDHTLNLQNLVAGQYNVRLVSGTGEVLDTKTLIVQ